MLFESPCRWYTAVIAYSTFGITFTTARWKVSRLVYFGWLRKESSIPVSTKRKTQGAIASFPRFIIFNIGFTSEDEGRVRKGHTDSGKIYLNHQSDRWQGSRGIPAEGDPLKALIGRYAMPLVLTDRNLVHFKFQRAIQHVVQVQVNFVLSRWPELVVAHVEREYILISGGHFGLVKQQIGLLPLNLNRSPDRF